MAWARIAASFAACCSVASIRAAMCSSGVPNGSSSALPIPANGLSDESVKWFMPASRTLRGIAVK